MNRPAIPFARPVEPGGLRAPGQESRIQRRAEAGIDRALWRWVRPLGGAAILGVVLAAVGAGTAMDALRATGGPSLALGAGVAVLTTACAAWRWRLVARCLDAQITMRSAIAACYRAQFLNVTLPGGVLGDIGRGVRHGRQLDDMGRGLRAVAWERTSGQVVLALLTVSVLLVVRPFSSPTLVVPVWPGIAVGALCLGVALAASSRRRSTANQVRRVAAADARALLDPTASVGIVLASLAVVAGHVATFVIAARAVGVRMPVVGLLPLALVVLVVAALPLNLAGWGPREGAAAWAFGAAGLGATQGVAVAVAYGAIVFVGTVPGAVLLLAGRSGGSWSRMPPGGPPPPRSSRSVAHEVDGTVHG